LIARSRKPIECVLEDPVQKMLVVPNRPRMQTVDLAASNSDTPVDSATTVYPIHVDCEEEW